MKQTKLALMMQEQESHVMGQGTTAVQHQPTPLRTQGSAASNRRFHPHHSQLNSVWDYPFPHLITKHLCHRPPGSRAQTRPAPSRSRPRIPYHYPFILPTLSAPASAWLRNSKNALLSNTTIELREATFAFQARPLKSSNHKSFVMSLLQAW